jgi:hypothetical protein
MAVDGQGRIWSRRIPVRRLLRDGIAAASLAAILFAWVFLQQGDFFHDARAYWSLDYSDMYGQSLVGAPATYLYSPAFAHVFFPFTLLPWEVFAGIWSALNLAALVWLAGPVVAAILLYAPYSPVTDEITTGNIHLLLAAAIVVGFRAPALWAGPLLTKVTPAASILWFAGRRAWRSLACVLGATGAIVLASLVIDPAAWVEWIELLQRSAAVPVPPYIGVIPGPLWLRLAVASALAAVGGILGWRWTVPVAATIALPVTWSSGLAILVALIPLYRMQLLSLARRVAACRLSGIGASPRSVPGHSDDAGAKDQHSP